MENLEYMPKIMEASLFLERIKIASKDEKFYSTMCDFKYKIFDTYMIAYQNLIINVASCMMQVHEDENISKYIKNYKDTFYRHSYKKLFDDLEMDHKMVLLFKFIQEPLERSIWTIIEDGINKFKNLSNGVKFQTFGEILDSLIKWADLPLLNLSGLYISCMDLSYKIVSDANVVDCSKCLECSDCDMKLEDQSIRVILTPELMFSPHWCENLLNTIENYHLNPKRISMVVDCKLLDKTIPENLKKHYEKAERIFKSVNIIHNTERIESNKELQYETS